jgi:hypothetical protein
MNRYISGDLMNHTKSYVVMYMTACSSSEAILEDVSMSICRGINKEDVIRKLILQGNFLFIWFVTGFIASYPEKINAPYKDFDRTERIFARLGQEYDDQSLRDLDEDDPKICSYIKRNLDEIVYLLTLYEEVGCDYLSIKEYSSYLMENQERV